MQYQVVYDLIEAINASGQNVYQKATGFNLLKRTMDSAIDLSIQSAKMAEIYVRVEEEYNNRLSDANKKFNKFLDEIETEKMQALFEDLSSCFEQIIEMGKQFGVTTGLENVDLQEDIDVMLEGKQLVDEMADNGFLRYTMYKDKENPLSLEEAKQILKEKKAQREIEITRMNNPRKEEKAEEKDFQHKIEKAEKEKEKMDKKIDKEIQALDL